MSRIVFAAAAVVGLTVGVALGLSHERFALLTPSSALSIFDRDATQADAVPVEIGARSDTVDSRLITQVGDTSVFALRSVVDIATGARSPEPTVCVVASAPRLIFTQLTCSPASVVEQQGLRVTLSGFGSDESTVPFPWISSQVLAVAWHPSGTIDVTDVSDEVLVPDAELYTDEEREAGLDIPQIDFLRAGGIDSEASAFLRETVSLAALGPSSVGSSSGSFGSVEGFLSVHDDGAPGEDRSVCLTLREGGEFREPSCTALDTFREDGVSATFDGDTSSVVVRVEPPLGVTFDSSGDPAP